MLCNPESPATLPLPESALVPRELEGGWLTHLKHLSTSLLWSWVKTCSPNTKFSPIPFKWQAANSLSDDSFWAESRCFACKAWAGERVIITQRMENICKMSRSPVFHGIRHLKMSQMVSLEDYNVQRSKHICLFTSSFERPSCGTSCEANGIKKRMLAMESRQTQVPKLVL